MFPHPAGPHAQPGRPPSRFLRTLAAAAGLGLAGLSAAPAADPPVPDVVLARSALAALDADPQLRDVTLLVSVVDRVAVVGGAVPSADAGRRAEGVVRTVPGIAEVKNRCYVQAGPDPLFRALASALPPAPRRPTAADLPGVVPSPKTDLTEEMIVPPAEGSFAAVVPTEKSVVARRPANPGASVLLPPVGPAGSRPPAAAPTSPALPPGMLTSVPPLPPPATVPGRPADVLAAAEAARAADRRFAGLAVSLRDGTLVIAGTEDRAGDAWDLAQQLRRIPGVARVAVGAVEVR